MNKSNKSNITLSKVKFALGTIKCLFCFLVHIEQLKTKENIKLSLLRKK